MIEEEHTLCPECGQVVVSRWANPGWRQRGGCLPSPDYVLVADWIYHSTCWDALVERNPP